MDDAKDDRVDAIIARYYLDVDAGQIADWRDLLPQHPDCANELVAFFTADERMDRFGAPLRPLQRRELNPRDGDVTRRFGLAETPLCANNLDVPHIVGDYELEGEIARGGMGVVYRARQRSLNRHVALKMIGTQSSLAQEDRRRFRIEAEAAACLDHPNIVPIHEVGEWLGQPYFTMKLITGGNLTDLIAQGTTDQPQWAASMVATVARAVHYAHQRGIIHRDLKPANILLTRDTESDRWIPYVSDFGLAKRLDGDADLTQSGAIVGTPNYMAPEQASGAKSLTTGVDIYSLGLILYELLTGRKPFQADTPLATLQRVQNDDPTRPSVLNTRVDRDLEIICLKCLEKQPRARYASAEILAEDLERWMAGEPIAARPVSRRERAARWISRNPLVAGLAASLVALGILGVAGITWQWFDARTQWHRAEHERELAEAARSQTAEKAKALEHALYFHQVNQAEREWRDFKVLNALNLLERCPAAERNWEWNYVHRLCTGQRRVLDNTNAYSAGVVFSFDGTKLFAYGRKAAVFDVSTGKPILEWTGRYSSSAFSMDGKQLVVVSNRTITTVELADGRVSHSIDVKDSKVVPVVSRDGRSFAMFDTKLRVGSVKDGTIVWTWESDNPETPRRLAFSSNSRFLAVAQKNAISVINIHRNKLAGSTYAADSGVMEFSPDNETMAFAGKSDVRTWDFKEKGTARSLPAGSRISGLSYDGEGDRLAITNSDRTVAIWKGNVVEQTLRCCGKVYQIAFAPNGANLATAGTELCIWDTSRDAESIVIEGRNAALSANGRTIASFVRSDVKFWNARDGAPRGGLPAVTGRKLEYFPDDKRLAVLKSESVDLWALGSEPHVVKSVKGVPSLQCIALSPNGKHMAIAARDLRVVDLAIDKVEWHVQGHPATINRVAFDSSGTRLISAGDDKIACVWDAASGKLMHRLRHDHPVASAAFSPDGRHVVTVGQNGASLWQTDTGQRVRRFGFDESVARDDEHARPPTDDPSGFVDAVFSAEGNRLATSGRDQTVKIWDVETGQLTLTLRHRLNQPSLTCSANGLLLASSSTGALLYDFGPPEAR